MPPESAAVFPTPLSAYPPAVAGNLLATLADRIAQDPFNLWATAIFAVAILHTFTAARFTRLAHQRQHAADHRADAEGRPRRPDVAAEMLHFLGEVEVVFGLWVVALVGVIVRFHGWDTAKHYLNDTVVYTEPLFVVVIMALSATRPIIELAERSLRAIASLGGGTPGAWWVTIITIGPLLGSFITEPGAMTISALLLARQFYDLNPSMRLKLGTIGLLFVNVSIGGTLTHFAAPPILMVARVWNWDTPYVLGHFGWRAVVSVLTSTLIYYLFFRRELVSLADRPPVADSSTNDDGSAPFDPIPAWVTVVHVLFLVWTVANSHYPALFVGGFLFFLGFVKATSPYQGRVELRSPMLVGFFLAGLVIHGGLQAWWIAPVLSGLSAEPLFLTAAALTAFNDNALITYLATLVPNLSDSLKTAVVEGAVTGGGLTLIANAPNPAGHAILSRFFDGAVPPLGLLLSALIPTLIATVMFRGI